jgi:protein-disulfide isomerase
MTDEAGIRDRVEILAKTIREANDAGIVSSPAFVVEKQLPYGSPLIEDEDLPDYALEFFRELHDVYQLFSHLS